MSWLGRLHREAQGGRWREAFYTVLVLLALPDASQATSSSWIPRVSTLAS